MQTRNAINLITDDLDAIAEYLPTLDLADLTTLGTKLNVLIEQTRNEWRARRSTPTLVSVPTPVPTVEPTEWTIPDGKYTVVIGSEHRTIRISTQDEDADFAPGKRIAAFLSGPDNYTNYTGFAFVDANGTATLWKRFRGDSVLAQALAILLSGKEGAINGLRAYGMESGRCGICGRELTVPESIEMGIGPVCAEKIGL